MRNANKLVDDTDKHQSKINFAQLHYVLSYGYLNLKEFKKSLANLEDGIQYQNDYIDDILKGKQNIRIQAETAVGSSSNKPQGKLRVDKLQEMFDNELSQAGGSSLNLGLTEVIVRQLRIDQVK